VYPAHTPAHRKGQVRHLTLAGVGGGGVGGGGVLHGETPG